MEKTKHCADCDSSAPSGYDYFKQGLVYMGDDRHFASTPIVEITADEDDEQDFWSPRATSASSVGVDIEHESKGQGSSVSGSTDIFQDFWSPRATSASSVGVDIEHESKGQGSSVSGGTDIFNDFWSPRATSASSVGVDKEHKSKGQGQYVSGLTDHTCRVCEKKFSSKSTLTRHMDLHTGVTFRCRICKRPFKDKSSSLKHEYSHMSREQLASLQAFHEECQLCHLVFFKRSHYEVHMNSHKKERGLECQECKIQFTTKKALNAHILSHHGDAETAKKLLDSRRFLCTFPNCTARFPSNSKVEEHLHTHSPTKEFRCSKCNKFFQTPKTKNSHMRKCMSPVKQSKFRFVKKTSNQSPGT